MGKNIIKMRQIGWKIIIEGILVENILKKLMELRLKRRIANET